MAGNYQLRDMKALLTSHNLLSWFECEMTPPGSCTCMLGLPAGDVDWEGCRTFQEGGTACKGGSLEAGLW